MRIVVALGGNALQRRGEPMTIEGQRHNVALACIPLLLWCLLSLAVTARLPLHSTFRLALWLAVTIGAGALVFWLTSALLRSTERTALWTMLPWQRAR